MSADWPIKTLQDVCEKITDGAHNSPKSVGVGKPMTSVKDLTSFGVELKEARHISIDDFDKLVKQGCQPMVGDVLIAKDGNSALDTVCNVRKPLDAVLLSSVAILRPDPQKIDSDFLKYYFTSQDTINYLKSNFISGAAIPRVVLKDFKKAQIKLPPLEVQKNISVVLSSLDNKIELNRQINQTLEEMAQAIFKSWFVDFEPVKAKIEARKNGRDPERAAMSAISGKSDAELNQLPANQLSQLATTAALFPDDLVESELGIIPKGWKVSNIGEEFNLTMGQSPPGNTYNENKSGISFFQGRRDFGWRYPVNRVYCTAPKRFAKSGDTLLSVRAPVGDINKATTDCCIGRGLAAIRHKTNCEAYTYYAIKRLDQHFNNFDNEGTVFGSINQKDLKAITIIKPDDKVLRPFSKITSTLDRKILNLEKQTSTLTQLRDTLLPKLLSGEISVNRAKAKIEAAV
ncbi:MAG: restriction endonuclease subunit S [Deltaproteobacteria bacterium]|nr:MAG: restriction endonuclease subunit S [Deltaproteobacteria bacterium]